MKKQNKGLFNEIELFKEHMYKLGYTKALDEVEKMIEVNKGKNKDINDMINFLLKKIKELRMPQ